MRIPRRRASRIAIGAITAVVAVLVLMQLLLPGIAAQRVRDELARYGVVRSATISAFPAIQLLWRHAQSASIRAGDLSMGTSQASEMLWKARGVERFDLSAESMRIGSITMHGFHARKRGTSLYVTGSAGSADLLGVLPGGAEMQPLGSVPGGVEVRVSGNLFGAGTSVDALLSVQGGKLVAQPQGIPFAGFVKLTLFSDPHMTLSGFDLTSPAAGGSDPRYLIKLWGRQH
jgi:hypothetical protein